LGDVLNVAGGLGGINRNRSGNQGTSSNIHGNSNSSTSPNHNYVIVDTQNKNTLHKTGISGQSLNKNGSSPRANSQVSKLNQVQPGRYKAVVVENNSSRVQAKNLEQTITDKYAARNNFSLPPGMQKPVPQVNSQVMFQQKYGFPHNTSLGGRY
jgi:hypothetical protein